MKKLIALYIAGYLISVVLVTGWDFAYWQGKYPQSAYKDYRRDLGSSMSMSFVIMTLWPVMMPVIYMRTGFAEHGWNVMPPDPPTD